MVKWIDGTILGMGRGAGNAETEYLLTEFDGYKSEEVYELVMKFLPLKDKYGWGPSLFYYLAAEHNIHPTFVQKLSENWQPIVVLRAIHFLKDKETNFFNKELYEESIK